MFVYYYNCIFNDKIFIGINSFKMFMAYKDVFMLRDDEVGGWVCPVGVVVSGRVRCRCSRPLRGVRRLALLLRFTLRMVTSLL